MEVLESLEKILDENPEEFILDNNVLDTRYRGLSLTDSTFDAGFITEIESELFESHLIKLKRLRGILEKSNVCFIKEVTEEYKNFQEKILEKYHWFKGMDFGRKKELRETNLGNYNQINTEVYEILKEVKRKEKRTGSNLYKKILKCVELVSREFYHKKETDYRTLRGIERKKDKIPSNLHTDEKIIAFAFEKALTENRNLSIVSNDGPMKALFDISYNLLTCLELNHCMPDLRKNNISFYGILSGYRPAYSLLTKTSDKKMQEKFLFPEKDNGTNGYIRRIMDSILSKPDN